MKYLLTIIGISLYFLDQGWSQRADMSYKVLKYKTQKDFNICATYFLSGEEQLKQTDMYYSQVVIGDPDLFATEIYALDLMVKKNVISAEKKAYYLKSTMNLSPEQLTYVELFRGSERVSTLRMVAGQSLESCGIGCVKVNFNYTMPWVDEFATFGALDRNKYKYIWNFSRAGASELDLIGENLNMLTYFAYHDLSLLKGSLDDAFVFIHSTSELNTRLYLGKYKFKFFRSLDKKNTVLIKPLKELLDDYPPELFFENINILKQAGLNLSEIMDVLTSLSQIQTRTFNVQKEISGISSEITLRYGLKMQDDAFEKITSKYNLNKEIKEKLRSKYLHPLPTDAEYIRPNNLEMDKIIISSEGTIEIENFRPAGVKEPSAKDLRRILSAVVWQIHEDLRLQGIKNPLEKIKNTNLVMQTKLIPERITPYQEVGFKLLKDPTSKSLEFSNKRASVITNEIGITSRTYDVHRAVLYISGADAVEIYDVEKASRKLLSNSLGGLGSGMVQNLIP